MRSFPLLLSIIPCIIFRSSSTRGLTPHVAFACHPFHRSPYTISDSFAKPSPYHRSHNIHLSRGLFSPFAWATLLPLENIFLWHVVCYFFTFTTYSRSSPFYHRASGGRGILTFPLVFHLYFPYISIQLSVGALVHRVSRISCM